MIDNLARLLDISFNDLASKFTNLGNGTYKLETSDLLSFVATA
jgi:hypothetical protein